MDLSVGNSGKQAALAQQLGRILDGRESQTGTLRNVQ